MKSRASNAVVLSLIVAVQVGASSIGHAAQPLRNNYICASPPGCTGGFQSSADRDVGQVMLHFTVAEGTPDGIYGWSYIADNTSGGDYSVTVQNGVVTFGQNWIIWSTPGYFWGTNTIGVVTVYGSEHVYVPAPTTDGFYPTDGYHDCCCAYGCTSTTTYTQVVELIVGVGLPLDPNKTRECDLKTGCSNCAAEPMASYSMHLILASLHIEDTPISYYSPLGPSSAFKVSYNQREANQPSTFSYGNFGSKWTHNWLSYVTDDASTGGSTSPSVYVRGGGTEVFTGFDVPTQSYAPDPQTLAVLVRTSNSTYERRFPDGTKEIFAQSDGATSYPRRIFLSNVVDATGNASTLTYDGSFRITSITDALGRSISFSYSLTNDQLKITKVTDPFGRFASFEYTAGKLTKIIDPIGIQSEFTYETDSDFINSLTTPYGTTNFRKGEFGNLVRWLEATDPLGGKERVEYNNAAPNLAASEASAPPGFYNSGLQLRNTFYWNKKAMAEAPGDYSKAQVFHWLASQDGKISSIKHSDKKALEQRVWYSYSEQPDPTKVGKNALPIKVGRLLDGNMTQLWQYNYNTLGNLTSEVDPVGRVKSYRYDTNNIDVLEIFQRNSTGASLDPEGQPADKLASYSYNSLHEALTETDAAGQVTTNTYNAAGQIISRRNAKNETTAYTYGGTVPFGYLASIVSPPFNGVSAVTGFRYDGCGRIEKVTNEADHATTVITYDNLDRTSTITYPDKTYEQFQYTDNVTGVMTLDLTGNRDRSGQWTYRHYDANRKMDEITGPLGRTTHYGWCACGALASITDPNGNVTTFRRDLEGRLYQKVFADSTAINYLFEGQSAPNTVGTTSRLKSVADALSRRTNYSYNADNNISQITYTDLSGNALNPPTPGVSYTYDAYHNRLATMTDGGGATTYAYHPITSSPILGAGELASIDGPLTNDTISLTYDELGRKLSESISGVTETVTYDSLGRVATNSNALGEFVRTYDGVTHRLQTHSRQNGLKTNYDYYGIDQDRRLRTLQNLTASNANLSKFDYTYDGGGQITNWSKLLGLTTTGLWFEYDAAQQLGSARNAANPVLASYRYEYWYDRLGNRKSDSSYDPRPGGTSTGTVTSYTANALNQLDSRTVQQNNRAPVRSFLLYDAAGNLTNDGQNMTFEWDAANRLVAVNQAATARRSEFAYDGFGRRIGIVEKTGAMVTSKRKFVWSGHRIVEEQESSNTITRRFFAEGEQRRGNDGVLRNYYYTRDHLDSVREVTDDAGTVLVRYDYDPYGNQIGLPGEIDVYFRYTGHFHHQPSGLALAHYRVYHPTLGRWISRDPLEENAGINLYANVENDPINRIDPLGLLDFRYYGNWGGPGWTGGQRRPYENLTQVEITNLTPPIDAQDHCYMLHDVCYSRCRTRNGCVGGSNPNREQKKRENTCEANCDYNLAACLSSLVRQDLHSRVGRTVFTWRSALR